MKPYVICHMAASVDGRILPSRWRPASEAVGRLYERMHAELEGDAWLVGRITGQEFAQANTYDTTARRRYPREPWIRRRKAEAFGIVIDAQGKIAWGRSEIGGDPIVVILTEQVPDAHLAGLRRDGVSYLFAGKKTVNLALALRRLNRELGVKRLLLEGGGVMNGAFLRAGLVDELSLLVCPAVDGAKGAPSVFDSLAGEAGIAPPLRAMSLEHCETLPGGAVWLRYRMRSR